MLSLLSPAKVNLFLRILRRRADGYHELASLFQAISLCDQLHFEVADRDVLTCTDNSLPTDHTNLVMKAVNLFKRKSGIQQNFAIHLEKHIPQQAGLGGGSSNAATTLWALNQLSSQPATEIELAQWGAEIGSDISFFLSLGTAYCTGRGEILRPLKPLPTLSMQIVKPSQGLSTPQVYGRLDALSLLQRDPEEALKGFLESTPNYFNDLEIPAFAALPELGSLKRQLQQSGFRDVLLCGSGSSFFCVGEGSIPKMHGLSAFSAHTINRSPNTWYSK